MKKSLEKTLSELQIRRSNAAADRMQAINLALRYGRLPSDLGRKLAGFFPESMDRSFLPHPKLDLFLQSLRNHEAGYRRFRRSETADAISYALAYFWEEEDLQPDRLEGGLTDDWMVLERIYKAFNRELGDFLLWSRRDAILRQWRGRETF